MAAIFGDHNYTPRLYRTEIRASSLPTPPTTDPSKLNTIKAIPSASVRDRASAPFAKSAITNIEGVIAKYFVENPPQKWEGMKLRFRCMLNLNSLNKLHRYVYHQAELSAFGRMPKVEYEVPGILVVGLPSREHDRVAASAEKLVRQQLWEGGFYWGTWGANKDGIQRRGNEGVDRTSSQGTSRSAPDGSLWIEAMCTTKPLFVFEVALSEEYDHSYDKCKMWMTQHNGLIKFAVLINIEKWKRKEAKNDSSGGEGPVSPLRDSRKRSLPADNGDEPGKRARSVPANTQPSGVPDMEFQEGEDLTDIEDLEEFEPKDATGPRPKTHKFKRVTVSVFGTKMTDSGRMITTVVPTLEIWPAKPADSNTWQLSWADINPKTPDEHKDKKVQVTFASLHDFLVTEMRRHEPQADPAIALDEDPVSAAQASGSEYNPGESVVEA